MFKFGTNRIVPGLLCSICYFSVQIGYKKNARTTIFYVFSSAQIGCKLDTRIAVFVCCISVTIGMPTRCMHLTSASSIPCHMFPTMFFECKKIWNYQKERNKDGMEFLLPSVCSLMIFG